MLLFTLISIPFLSFHHTLILNVKKQLREPRAKRGIAPRGKAPFSP